MDGGRGLRRPSASLTKRLEVRLPELGGGVPATIEGYRPVVVALALCGSRGVLARPPLVSARALRVLQSTSLIQAFRRRACSSTQLRTTGA